MEVNVYFSPFVRASVSHLAGTGVNCALMFSHGIQEESI